MTEAPADLAARIAFAIQGLRVNVTSESSAHDGVEAGLRAAGFHVEREVRLSPRDRVDLMIGPVAVEVKVKKSQGRRQIFKQLQRYAEHERVGALVLAAAASWPRSMTEVDGKPLRLASLSQGWL
ncbi:hypothetical protein [Leisingera daeponensis]|uniref:hypothetical protein n=1 Tax=Leisingera daeponensis TaxID=405746 RepID=UPI001C98A042|nr:hypothetical protein [Leisingera daeponensis]MBY6055349.1 hypothetical protein [Leisingera daeponensis]